ncbi:MAG: hypothetical protein WCP01_15365 [Methylococcaceae bacterium]
MNHIATESDANKVNQGTEHKSLNANQTSKGELVVKGVATAVAASAIIQSGKGVMSLLGRHPLVVFGLGITAGYLTHKYRKEIISITSKTTEQSRDFVLRQKENLKELLAESQDDAGNQDASK